MRFDGEGKPPVTDGPFAETKDLIAGWMVIDVESVERAHEAAALLSSAPGPGGEPIKEWIEVRPFLETPPNMSDVTMDQLVRELVPQVLGILVRRGADFAAAEDAVQEALVEAVRRWPDEPPDDPKGWLVTVSWRKFIDAGRSESARRTARGARATTSRRPDPPSSTTTPCCCSSSPATRRSRRTSAVALTLRAVGGLTTRADRRGLPRARVDDGAADQPGQAHDRPGGRRALRATCGGCSRVLYLIFNEGYTGDVDLAAEAIRLTRALTPRPATSRRWPACWR